jgi:hypothetical protein
LPRIGECLYYLDTDMDNAIARWAVGEMGEV